MDNANPRVASRLKYDQFNRYQMNYIHQALVMKLQSLIGKNVKLLLYSDINQKISGKHQFDKVKVHFVV